MDSRHAVMENLTNGFQHPSVMDVKVRGSNHLMYETWINRFVKSVVNILVSISGYYSL